MILSLLTLQQFRSYVRRSFTFSSHTTLIVGPNTIGKTNILEAIMMLTTGKSFRADADREAIRWNQEFARITGMVDKDKKLELVLTPKIKRYLVNGIPRRQIDFVGNLRAVLFWPEHLDLVTDSPSIRRKYLDYVLVQVDREYRRNLLSYERGLRQRNKLLDLINDGKAHRHQLLFWNQLLIKSGGFITDKRAGFIEFINQNSEDNRIEYDKSVISDTRLEEYADEEIAAKATLVGPHRDDFLVTKKGLDLSKYGSRGEQRLAILWLKLAELTFMEEETGERPMLLLDDIFSELDEEHRKFVLGLLGSQQTIITTAENSTVQLFKNRRIKADTIRL